MMKSLIAAFLAAAPVLAQLRDCPRVDVCAEGVEPVTDDKGCISCRKSTCTTPPECTKSPPSLDSSGCKTCVCPSVPTCVDGAAPVRNDLTQCPSCKPEPCSTPPLCAADERPTLLNGCPTCFRCPLPDPCAENVAPETLENGCSSCQRTCPVPPDCPQGGTVSIVNGCPSCKVPCPKVDPCAENVAPEKDSNNCLSCTPPERKICTVEQFQQVPVCTADQTAQRNEETGCPTCVTPPAPTCSDDQIKACLVDLRVCEADERPVRLEDACCYTCRIPRDEIVCDRDIQICASDVRPELVDGCPTCRFSSTGSTVDSSCELSMCPRPPACGADEAPVRINNCCPSCYVAREESTCTTEKVTACRESYPTLPACNSSSEFVLNKETCCYPCRKAELEHRAEGTDATASLETRCTREAYAACVEVAEVCDSENAVQDRLFVDSACCPTCTRPERECDIEAVSKCKSVQPACAEVETPARVAGDCCSSCALPVEKEPTCTQVTCDSTQVCSRRGAGKTACAIAAVKKIIMERQLGQDAACPTYTREQIRHFAVEIVKRYCDKTVNAENCKTLGDRLFNFAIKTAVKKASTNATLCETEVGIAADSEKVSRNATRRKRVEEISPADILADAIGQDPEATGEFTAKVIQGDAPTPTPTPDLSSAAALAVGVATFAIFF